jgi:hypothetical protein
MHENQYHSLSDDQKRAVIEVVSEDCLRFFGAQYRETALAPLLQAWVSAPLYFDIAMRYPEPPTCEETKDIIKSRGEMASLLLVVLTNLFAVEKMLYRSPSFHITFKNKDGSSGSIVVDNLQSSAKNFIDTKTIKVVG